MLTYTETLDFLFQHEVERMDLGLERVEAALRLCGSPHTRVPIVHIAGTNGKGSTAAVVHAVLSAAGYRVGLFTSPHLVDFCERIRLGLNWISEQEVIDGVAEIRAQVEPAHIPLTPFEMMSLLAFHAFAQAGLDLAVVEVGLGGRLDATNVVSSLVSTITQIGLDHQAYLGTTLAQIAREKGGIIKPGVPVVIGNMDEDSRTILCDMAHQAGSPSFVFGTDFSVQHTSQQTSQKTWSATECFSYQGQGWQFEDLHLGLRGPFQRDNAATALATLECLQARFPVSPTQLRNGLQKAVWPGRFQIVSEHSDFAEHSDLAEHPLVILDGAHNPQAVTALVDALSSVLHGRRVTLLFGVMQDKDWRAMLPALASIVDEVVVTQVQNGRAEDPHLVQEAFSAWCPTRVVSDSRIACQSLVNELNETGAGTALIVCGSLFLVGEVIPLFPAALAASGGGPESYASATPPKGKGGRNVGRNVG